MRRPDLWRKRWVSLAAFSAGVALLYWFLVEALSPRRPKL